MKKTILSSLILVNLIAFAQNNDSVKVKNIESVSISGKKKIIERKVDRLVYNVQNTIVSQGSSGAEVLASTPLLKVDEEKGTIIMAGKSGLSVMVNDRMLNLSGTELMNYLKNLRSENILKIEVITTPPAKYEAQGNSGIINIVLKKNVNLGWSGYTNTYYQQKTYGGFGGAFGLNYQNEKLKSSVKFRGFDDEKKSVENYNIIGQNSSYGKDVRRDMNDGLGINAEIDYSLSENANVGFVYDFAKGHSNMDIQSTTRYFTNEFNTLNIDTDSRHRSKYISQMLNLFYDQKIGNHKLSFGANYYGNLPENNTHFIATNLENQSRQLVRNLSTVDYNIYSSQGDLMLNLKKLKLETGLKYTQFSNQSDIGYYDFNEDNYMIDPQKSNLFNYTEKNYSAYLSANKNFGENWSAKFGLRYEYTQTNGFSPTSQTKSENQYGKLFPTAYVSYKASDDHRFGINYSRRINRPNFRALNPFRWYSNPNSFYTGNPELLASFNHNIEFNYNFKSKLDVSLYYAKGLNNFEQITFIDGVNVTSTYENYFNQNTYGFNLSYSDTFFKIWETNVSSSLSFNNSQILKYDAIARNGESFYYSINNTFRLNKAKTFFFFANFWQSVFSREGNGTSKSSCSLNAGIKLSLIEKTLQMNISVNDIFRTSGYRGSVYFKENTQNFNHYWDARRLIFSVTYNFGNRKVKSITRTKKFEEKNRAE